MCRVLLVRHGQANFGGKVYDELSETGHVQAMILGDYFSRLRLKPGFIGHGTLRRQRQTATIIAHRIAAEDRLQQLDWLDEVNSQFLLDRYAATLVKAFPEQQITTQDEPGIRLDKSNFAAVFKLLIGTWATDDTCPDESFTQFQNRVIDGLTNLVTKYQSTDTLILSTSGGVIGTLIQHALGLSLDKMIDVAIGLCNASITEFEITPEHWRLKGYNSVAALQLEQRSELITQL